MTGNCSAHSGGQTVRNEKCCACSTFVNVCGALSAVFTASTVFGSMPSPPFSEALACETLGCEKDGNRISYNCSLDPAIVRQRLLRILLRPNLITDLVRPSLGQGDPAGGVGSRPDGHEGCIASP